ncbi:MAG TPA: Fe-only nitrogenase accessory AnfO family protein [Negativicutes bacterium]|nr:Fe-only nitrogenase accessory AnfO family protein [Negativicutes bacterium]
MAKEIGAFVNESGVTTLLLQPCFLQVYRKQQGHWRKERKMAVNLGEARGLAEMRSRMRDVIEFLASCDTVMAEAFQGVALHELEKADVGMWEVAGSPEPSLDSILAEEEAAALMQESSVKTPVPVLESRGDGRFFISIVDVQKSGGGLTSKQVLLPIIRRGAVKEIEILCAHVPPWLEAEAIRRDWSYKTTKTQEQQICITITMTGP